MPLITGEDEGMDFPALGVADAPQGEALPAAPDQAITFLPRAQRSKLTPRLRPEPSSRPGTFLAA